MRIGIDLDNTIIDYNCLVYDICLSMNLIKKDFIKNKKKIKNYLLEENKSNEWRKVQYIIYGEKIIKAKIFKDFPKFIKECRKNKFDIKIISHKTNYSNLYNSGTNLREGAIKWMKRKNFFSDFGFKLSDIYFEDTREKKIERINKIGFDCFIDDLEEVFLNKNWSKKIKPILFSDYTSIKSKEITMCNSWNKIYNLIFKI